MGNFDGVHLGHQSVLALAHAAAAELASPFGVVTFEPHPRSFFTPDAPPFRLMTADARARRLDKLGVEILYELPFAAALAGLTPEAFARGMLADGLGVRHVVVGADFRFGKGRAGDVGRAAQARGDAGLRGHRGATGLGRAAATTPRPRSAPPSPTAGQRRRRASSGTGTGSRAACSTARSAAGRWGSRRRT